MDRFVAGAERVESGRSTAIFLTATEGELALELRNFRGDDRLSTRSFPLCGIESGMLPYDVSAPSSVWIYPQLAWDPVAGGLTLKYQVKEKAVEENAKVKLYWASGSSFSNRLGDAFFSIDVPKGTVQGMSSPISVLGDFLKNAPAGTTHLVAVCNDGDNAVALADVEVLFGASANQEAVSAATIDVLKDLLRLAGRKELTITSTARPPESQARAMFNNLVKSGDSEEQREARIDNQKNGDGTWSGYAAAGGAVIDRFATLASGKTAAQILADRATIESAMVEEINTQGPSKVSKHCADTSVLNVMDILNGVGQKFKTLALQDARVSKVLDENGVYHLEVPQ